MQKKEKKLAKKPSKGFIGFLKRSGSFLSRGSSRKKTENKDKTYQEPEVSLRKLTF